VNVAVGAVQVRGKPPDAHCALRIVEHAHGDTATADAQRSLQRFDHAITLGSREAHAILDHLERHAASAVRLAAPEEARVPLLLQQAEHFGLAEVVRHRHRHRDHDAVFVQPLRAQAFADFSVDALRRVAPHRRAAIAAI
jgi:hypothetical protein